MNNYKLVSKEGHLAEDDLWELLYGHLQPTNDIDSAFVKIIRTDTIYKT